VSKDPRLREWEVYLRGERLGVVRSVTWKAACLRAIQRFKIASADQQHLVVRRPVKEGAPR
jgi:hypothetical protein